MSVFKRHKTTRGFAKIYVSDLVRAMVRLLDDEAIYEVFLEAAAAAGTLARRPVEQVTKTVDKRADFVNWLLRRGIRHDDVRARLVAVQLLSGSRDDRVTAVLGKLALGREPGGDLGSAKRLEI